MNCEIDGCDRPPISRGMCNAHYMAWKRGRLPERGPTGDWTEHAACRDQVDLFALPVVSRGYRFGRTVRRQILAACQICATCPVREQCTEWALTTPDPAIHMIAAGMTPDDRAAARKRRAGVLR